MKKNIQEIDISFEIYYYLINKNIFGRTQIKKGGTMKFLMLAQTQQQSAPSLLGALLPLILIFFVFYFLLILPQQKKQKQHKKMLDDLKEGDKIVTVGGLIGVVSKIKDNIVTIDCGNGVKVDFLRNAISQVIKPQNDNK